MNYLDINRYLRFILPTLAILGAWLPPLAIIIVLTQVYRILRKHRTSHFLAALATPIIFVAIVTLFSTIIEILAPDFKQFQTLTFMLSIGSIATCLIHQIKLAPINLSFHKTYQLLLVGILIAWTILPVLSLPRPSSLFSLLHSGEDHAAHLGIVTYNSHMQSPSYFT